MVFYLTKLNLEIIIKLNLKNRAMHVKKLFLVVYGKTYNIKPKEIEENQLEVLSKTIESINSNIEDKEEILLWTPEENNFQLTAKLIYDRFLKLNKNIQMEIKNECWGHHAIHSKESFQSTNDFQCLRNSVSNSSYTNIIVVSNINYIRNITKFYGLGKNQINYGEGILIKTEGIKF